MIHFSDTGMVMFNDLVQIVEKYWKNYENYEQELREACNAFGKYKFKLE